MTNDKISTNADDEPGSRKAEQTRLATEQSQASAPVNQAQQTQRSPGQRPAPGRRPLFRS